MYKVLCRVHPVRDTPVRLSLRYTRSFSGSVKSISLLNITDSSTDQLSINNFITTIIENDIANNINDGRVLTRFPPEPNGYLHLGHAKAVNFNFGVAKRYGGLTNMRLDDTNPAKEDLEYVKAIADDVRWLLTGDSNASAATPWVGNIRHASDYFPQMYEAAEYLVAQGLAYVDDLTADEIKEYRGSIHKPGRDSPFRTRSVEENLRLFRAMKAGAFSEGQCVLRAKIDMASGNLNMRDPLLYRIKREAHPMTGSAWCVYPMYDFAHPMSDALEGITHSLCTLEFEAHRALYDWVVDRVLPSGILPYRDQGWRPHQYEFSRLNVQHTVLSKRKLLQLVQRGHVSGWDDPRMPTVCGLRRRGFPHTALKLFCERVGVTKTDSVVDMSILEESAREVLDHSCVRLFAVLRPLKVTITNWEGGAERVEMFSTDNHPKRPELGTREMPFSGSVLIDREDFHDAGPDGSRAPPKGFKRLLQGGQVRLRCTYVITCNDVVRCAASGEVLELLCTYSADTRAGATPAGAPKAKGIIPWVSAQHAVPVVARLYDRLMLSPAPGGLSDEEFLQDLNPASLVTCAQAVVEPALRQAVADPAGSHTYQFERQGYFALDRESSTRVAGGLVFNRVVTLKDSWVGQGTADAEGLAAVKTNPNKGSGSNSSSGGAAAAAVEDIRRIELRVGVVLSAERHPDADSLYVERVDCGDATGPRTIISGLVKFVPVEELVGRKVVVVCNLKPSKMRGIMSEGMLLCASSSDTAGDKGTVELLTPPVGAKVGELISVSGYGPPVPDAQLKSKRAQEVWKRVAVELATNGDREAMFGGQQSPAGKLMTSAGPCVVGSLANAPIS